MDSAIPLSFFRAKPNPFSALMTEASAGSLKAIGLDSKHLTAHSLRHTLAVSILRAGGSLADAQGVLRHANPATTQIYTRSIDEEMRIKNAPEELIESLY